jgi:cell wall-associated NlpC family hydrolase
MTTWKDALEMYLQCRTKGLVLKTDELSACLDEEKAEAIKRYNTWRWKQLTERNARPLKSKLQINGLQVEKESWGEVVVRIEAREWYAYQLERQWHEQEKEIQMRIVLNRVKGKWLVVQEEKIRGVSEEAAVPVFAEEDVHEDEEQTERQYVYKRLQAIRYAEAWWNGHNPQYRFFDVNCTNFVSQCLYAGGIPMRAVGNRSSGWWYEGRDSPSASWSYSWAVAHSFRWYLEKGVHIKTEVKSSADQLSLGDVICYDFEGDGRWDHSTIVVAKDSQGMPLVNAHTTNSRHRYWDYRDSTAYTSDIQYCFFHIV